MIQQAFGEPLMNNKRGAGRARKLIRKTVEMLEEEQLFKNIPGRKHDAFPNFFFTTNLSNPAGYLATFKRHKKALANSRRRALNA